MPDPATAAFIGHGTPMNALEDNRHTRTWRELGATLPHPRAILVVSAHWYINASAVTAMDRPRTIHDFFGFPDELFAVDYPAPGDPGLAQEIADTVAPTWVGLDADSWGLDHGTWSVLGHLAPAADVAVLQLSIDATKSFDEHVELGSRLVPLLERGVFVLGSGNVVHHLGRLDWGSADAGADWARRFDDAAREVLTTDPAAAPRLREHPDFGDAVPTPDHFIPVLYVAGLAAATGRALRAVDQSYAYGSLSMTSYVLEAD